MSLTYSIQLFMCLGKKREKLNTYCLRRSANLEVRADISPRERRMSSLSLGSSHNSAIFRASVKAPRICSSPSGPPFGSASQFYIHRNRKEAHWDLLINQGIRKISKVITRNTSNHFIMLILILLPRFLAQVKSDWSFIFF